METVPETIPPSPRQRTGSDRLITYRPRMRPETAAHFGAGFASKGIMRGRFAIPVHDPAGILLAYCGRAVKDESPLLLFPNGFDPRIAIFDANRMVEGDLTPPYPNVR